MRDDDSSLASALRWVMDIDPATVIADVDKRRRAAASETGGGGGGSGGGPGADAGPDVAGSDAVRRIAERLVESYARKAGVQGFLLGLGSNPLVMVGTALGDVALVLRMYAHMSAEIGYLANPRYFDDPDWKDDALLMLAGPKVVSHAMKQAGVQFGKQGSKVLIKRYLSKGVLAALKRMVLKWFGKKVTQRMILTKVVPVVGGAVGGTWNYLEVRVIGGRIIAYHFDGVLA